VDRPPEQQQILEELQRMRHWLEEIQQEIKALKKAIHDGCK
jgi:prefoldin subunit 5